MPYCSNCGTFISEAILLQNEGLCNHCHLNFSKKDIKQTVDIVEAKNISSIKKCAECGDIAGVHCKECGKLLCEKHMMIYHTKSSSRIVCSTCHSKLQDDAMKMCLCCGIPFLFFIFFMIFMSLF